ncbi:follistatin-like 5 precursor [Saccoglossus kowalevskii]|uniref:Follistatin 5 n=1 Tax=Saccoglossus kowalevskii TaxID=10224 RepID=D1LX16_SACKO|nr:follistatin-like 5 precursor [Saccoglossus kowalevskii]ACY92522.1 follistatin 5 [Saccoglossus kowalevskii]
MKTIILVGTLLLAVVEARTRLHFKKSEDINDGCLTVYCGNGRECQTNQDGDPECVCMSSCKPHRKPVCGSDGKRYDNHCELHRAACLQNKKIAIAHNKECFYNDDRCNKEDYVVMKEQVLQHHMDEFTDPSADTGNAAAPPVNKKFTVSMMFGFYDADNNELLDDAELVKVISKARLQDLTGFCSVLDLLRYDDTNQDRQIDVDEFYAAFGISMVSVPDDSLVVMTTGKLGEGLYLKCAISGEPEIRIRWKRNGIDLTDRDIEGIRTLDDHSLYFTSPTTLHTGNYTCHANIGEEVVQTHVLKVEVTPEVKVCPRSQILLPGSYAAMKCSAFGIPQPELSWKKNGVVMDTTASGHITVDANSTSILVNDLKYEDTGAYACSAVNPAGKQEAVASLFIEDQRRTMHHGPLDLFYVFHDNGIKVYDPKTCQLSRSILPADTIVGTEFHVCSSDTCSWGDAVEINRKFIYVTQPEENRVIIIEINTQQVIEVVPTDNVPVELQYVKYLDEIWVLCWGTLDKDNGQRTIEIIRKASEHIAHDTVHTQPIGNHFDLVQGIFIPPSALSMQDEYRYIYVVHKDELGLHKIDMEIMASIKAIDLSEYDCYPSDLAFTPIGGYVIVRCEGRDSVTAKQLILDYLTDDVITVMDAIKGKPYVSPDGRYIISVDNDSGSVTVQTVSECGCIAPSFDVHTNLHVSDIAFYPAKGSHTYDIFASSQDKTDVLFVDLKDGKVEMITGVGQAMDLTEWRWNANNRVIQGSGSFGPYLLSPAAQSVFILDGNTREERCQINNITHGNVVVWVGSC